jgi:hypothetical protein
MLQEDNGSISPLELSMWKKSMRKQNIINNILYRNMLQRNDHEYSEKTHDVVLTRMITRHTTAPSLKNISAIRLM